jgi:hypothetical protein
LYVQWGMAVVAPDFSVEEGVYQAFEFVVHMVSWHEISVAEPRVQCLIVSPDAGGVAQFSNNSLDSGDYRLECHSVRF